LKIGNKGCKSVVDHLQMINITKKFGDHTALSGVHFRAARGKVHALVGENGAGKTTLMKILSGLIHPDAGEIRIAGRPVTIASPKRAQELGIAMIYQDINLFPDLNIAENVFIRREPLRKWFGAIDWNKANREAAAYLESFGLDLNSRVPIRSLSVGQQKFVEIIRALSQNASVLIMDEPTAILTEQEIDQLFRAIAEVKKRGVAVIYISHRIEEIRRIADEITVMRDGTIVQSCGADELRMDEIIRVMVGREVKDRYPKLQVKIGDEALGVEGLTLQGRLKNISFSVRKGEIVGLTGLSGSGRRTLAKTLFGIYGPYEGEVRFNGKTFRSLTPHIAKTNGLCYISSASGEEGLIANAPIVENITLTNLKRVSRAGFIRHETELEFAEDLLDRLEIHADVNERADRLSGGMRKKLVLAKWLFTGAKVLIIEEPTAGVDTGSKIDIYNILNELLSAGASILLISSDLREVMGMCDRIIVMCDGEIRKIFHQGEATQEQIMFYASGGRQLPEPTAF